MQSLRKITTKWFSYVTSTSPVYVNTIWSLSPERLVAATVVLEPPSSMKTEYPSDVIVCSKTILEQITDVLCDAIIHVSASRTCE